MEENIIVSVIIPVYNCEKYIANTLDSVINQPMDPSEFEVLVIDDESKDRSYEIIQSYTEKYPNIHLFRQKNSGPGIARNTGLDHAKGRYVLFSDGDDLIENGIIPILVSKMEDKNADMIVGNYDMFTEYTHSRFIRLDDLVSQEYIDPRDVELLFTFSLSNKFFKREIIEEHHLRFKDIIYSEDGVFVYEYLKYVDKIAGLDQNIFHYRRFYEVGNSITSSIHSKGVSDLITALYYIRNSSREIFETCRKKGMKEDLSIDEYISILLEKEMRLIVARYYQKFWNLDPDTLTLINRRIEEIKKDVGFESYYLVCKEFPTCNLPNLQYDNTKILPGNLLEVVIPYKGSTEEFLECVGQLCNQLFVYYSILLPESARSLLEERDMIRGNMEFIPYETEEEMCRYALEHDTAVYLMVASPEYRYLPFILKRMVEALERRELDFMTCGVNIREYNCVQHTIYHEMFHREIIKRFPDKSFLCFDAFIYNKVFRKSFLRKYVNVYQEKGILDFIEKIYQKGTYDFSNTKALLYKGSAKQFYEEVIQSEYTEKYLHDRYDPPVTTLTDPRLDYDPALCYGKFQDIQKDELKAYYQEIMEAIKKPLINRTAFISFRSDGELSENMKVLYPMIHDRHKCFFAKKAPHTMEEAKTIIDMIFTSRIVIVDDYNRFLRLYPLRKSQKVIQIWHASGVFKKFGQHGTNLSLAMDSATHAQYNLVSVNGEHVRETTARAFDIDPVKVQAMGCPRTDELLNTRLIRKRAKNVYKIHPEYKDKYIIVYAPTFRDTGQGRAVFEPDIDFDELSAAMLPDQHMIICPHPVMKNDILKKTYPNITVERDLPTIEYLIISDVLITDYSSVIFEYSLLNRPMAFYCYDLDVYERGFYLKYPEDLPGDMFRERKELIDFVTDKSKHVLTEKHKRFIDMNMSSCDGKSGKRIAALINSYLKEK